MAYREKLAALNLAVLTLVYAAYFVVVASRPPAPRLVDMLWLFGIVAPIHAILVAVGSSAVKLQSGKDGAAPPDERDRAIERRGRSIAYLVLLVGTITVGIVMPFSERAATIVNTTLLMIVIAEVVHQGVILASYRRGWHG